MSRNAPKEHKRIIQMSGRKVVTYGMRTHFWQDIYYYAMTSSWPVFFLAFAVLFVVMNVLFAVLYLAGDNAIGNLYPQGFLGAFFFSVETLATVGYGDMHPQTAYGHWVSTSEIFIGMSGLALITGLIFARFSRPRSSIVFAEHPVSHVSEGKNLLMIRMANARMNVISEAAAKLRLIWNEESATNGKFRRIYDLKLERDQHPIFILGWTIFHVIDENSPLFGISPTVLLERQAALILSVDGIDETTNQNQRARHYYPCELIRWNHRYVDIFENQTVTTSKEMQDIQEIHYSRFHKSEEITNTFAEQSEETTA
ncbi:ion channel [Undibacterium sp. Ji22W]|uniref:ion channel n=1 Tax=Undibacterium sp. Ji22W TaxID=3413038 RepID=UPI003BF19C0B